MGGLGSRAVSPRERGAAARSARLRLSWPRRAVGPRVSALIPVLPGNSAQGTQVAT